MRTINKIIVHCSATPPSMNIGVQKIREWHKAKSWRDIGYHYVIKRNGDIQQGRDDAVSGAHVKGHNADSIGVCLVGGVDKDDNAVVNYTDAQWKALELIVRGLKGQHPRAAVKGHNDYTNAKTCPNFDVMKWYRSLG